MGDLASFGFFRQPRGVSRLTVRIFPATRGVSRRRMTGARELARYGVAGARLGVCELALILPNGLSLKFTECSVVYILHATECSVVYILHATYP